MPRDTQLCELANPAKWDNEEWLAILRSLGLSDDKLLMHRKPYEFAQLIYGCRRLGVLDGTTAVLSVGAGHEGVLYWLANHVRRVVATDMYEGVWQDVQGREGDPTCSAIRSATRRSRTAAIALVFMRMDGRRLAFRDGSFDVAYSLSSIEHFGGVEDAWATLREMGRVLRPGGIARAGHRVRPRRTAARGNVPARGIPATRRSTGARAGRADRRRGVSAATRSSRSISTAIRIETPHMLVRFNDTIFTTVMVFLRRKQ